MVIPILALLLPAAALPPVETVAYGDDPKQKVDVYRPVAGQGPTGTGTPVAIFWHGGVWQFGDRRVVANVGEALRERGILTIVASYRLAPDHRWPAQRDDADAVLALARRRATSWGGDPARITLVGHSAGAQLAALLALRPETPARVGVVGVVAISGVFDLTAPLDEGQHDGGLARFVTPVFGKDPQVLAAASPLTRVVAAPSAVPFLLITGDDDYRAMQRQGARMRDALAGATSIVVVKKRDHFDLVGHMGSPGDPTTDAVVRFISRRG